MGDTVIAMGCSSCGGKAARFRGSQAQVRARKQACCCCTAAERLLRDLEVIVGQHVFVDPVHGNDTTGSRERLDRPFLTISAALAAAHNGDTISLQPGTYIVSSPIVIPALDALGDPFAIGVVEAWGGAENVFLVAPGAVDIFTTVPGTSNNTDWLFQGLRVLTGNANFAFNIGDSTAQIFTGTKGLVLRDVIASRSRFRNVDGLVIDTCEMSSTFIYGCGDVEVFDSNFFPAFAFDAFESALNLDYGVLVSAPLVARAGYRFANVWADGDVYLSGPLLVAFDASCRAFGITADIAPNATLGLNPSVRYAGTLGENNHGSTHSGSGTFVLAVFNFGATAWQPTSGEVAGVDLSGMRCYGGVFFEFDSTNNPPPTNSREYFFGGDSCQIFDTLSVSDENLDPDPLYYVRFRNSAFGAGKFSNTGILGACPIIATRTNIDLRSCALGDDPGDVGLFVTGAAFADNTIAGIDRDSAFAWQDSTGVSSLANGINSLPVVYPSGGISPSPVYPGVPARFPDYVSDRLQPIVTRNDFVGSVDPTSGVSSYATNSGLVITFLGPTGSADGNSFSLKASVLRDSV